MHTPGDVKKLLDEAEAAYADFAHKLASIEHERQQLLGTALAAEDAQKLEILKKRIAQLTP